MTPKQLEEGLNKIVETNKAGLTSVAESLMKDVTEFCAENDVYPTDEEFASIMNFSQFNFEFKFSFYLAIEKLKIATKKKE